jgi:hypothetical protein
MGTSRLRCLQSLIAVDSLTIASMRLCNGSVNYPRPKGRELVKLQRVSTEETYIRLAGWHSACPIGMTSIRTGMVRLHFSNPLYS